MLDGMLTELPALLPGLTELYEDLHRHPELSFAEHRTAQVVADRLGKLGYDVTTRVGRTGVVGLLHNGAGPTVLLRADMDALPVRERTGLSYASVATATDATGRTDPVMHACGHDLHITWLIGAATILAMNRDAWAGTLMLVFQPAEELAAGAAAMIDDGLFEQFGRPDVGLGQHVGVGPAGAITYRPGVTAAACDSLRVTMFGRGGHASRPETTVDPVLMAASTIVRLNAVVSREVGAKDAAVVTVATVRAGTKENIIAGDAEFTVNVRSFDPAVRARVLAAIDRIIRGEAITSGAPQPPLVEPISSFDAVTNDEDSTLRVAGALSLYFGQERVTVVPPMMGSEDFGLFGERGGFPSVFWFVGSTDPDRHAQAKRDGRLEIDVPYNHSPLFAPVLETTLPTGVQTLVTAALAWLG
jgi:hippurate hydrolase